MSNRQPARPIIDQFIAQERLPPAFADVARNYFLPLSDYIAQCRLAASETSKSHHRCAQALVVGINGAQGTGKSTLSGLLRQLLQDRGLQCVVISIDDLYLTREERARLASDVHPLLKTRGVPGTHDLALGLTLLQALKSAAPGSLISIPHFDKARDDRSPVEHWQVHTGPVDIILLEGWCVGALPVSLTGDPLNQLEREHDADGVWRHYIEAQLLAYQRLFSQIDQLVMLKAPSMESIIEWRTLQEQKLLASANPAAREGIMNQDQLRWFIMHYERLTRSMLDTLPAHADVVFFLNAAHDIVEARYQQHKVYPTVPAPHHQ